MGAIKLYSMKSISIIIPGIRTHFWQRVTTSIAASISHYDYEIIFVGPFDLPQSLIGEPHVKYIKSYSPVPVCLQLGFKAATKDLIFQTVDDGVFLPMSLAKTLEEDVHGCGEFKYIVNMRYSEGVNFQDSIRPGNFFDVKNCPEFHLPYINKNWSTAVQPLMGRQHLYNLGGLDCRFEYSNHAHHDLMFRAQQDGARIVHSTYGIAQFEHYPMRSMDHGPIHDAQTEIDKSVFDELWSKPRVSKIDFQNYQQYDKPWQRRFGRNYKTYAEMFTEEGYQ